MLSLTSFSENSENTSLSVSFCFLLQTSLFSLMWCSLYWASYKKKDFNLFSSWFIPMVYLISLFSLLFLCFQAPSLSAIYICLPPSAGCHGRHTYSLSPIGPGRVGRSGGRIPPPPAPAEPAGAWCRGRDELQHCRDPRRCHGAGGGSGGGAGGKGALPRLRTGIRLPGGERGHPVGLC